MTISPVLTINVKRKTYHQSQPLCRLVFSLTGKINKPLFISISKDYNWLKWYWQGQITSIKPLFCYLTISAPCFDIIFVNMRAEGKLSVVFVLRIVCWLFMILSAIMTSRRAEWRPSRTSVRNIKCPWQILSQYSIIKGYQEKGLFI